VYCCNASLEKMFFGDAKEKAVRRKGLSRIWLNSTYKGNRPVCCWEAKSGQGGSLLTTRITGLGGDEREELGGQALFECTLAQKHDGKGRCRRETGFAKKAGNDASGEKGSPLTNAKVSDRVKNSAPSGMEDIKNEE